MEWTVTIEGRDDFGEVQRAQMRIEKSGYNLAILVCPDNWYGSKALLRKVADWLG